MSKKSKEIGKLRQLAQQPDRDINTSDAPEIADWSGAERGRFYRPIKQQVTLRIDADVLAWFRTKVNKYPTRINAAIRDYVEHNREPSKG